MQSLLTSNYEATVRPTLDLIENLRNVGIERYDIHIPQVVVVGDQSTGKSSILEGMSGISFPRGEGLVTRCATQINMKKIENASWKATVKVSMVVIVLETLMIFNCYDRFAEMVF